MPPPFLDVQIQVGAWAVPEPTPKRSKCLSKVSPAAFPRPFLGIALVCGLPGAARRFGVVAAAMDFAAVASGLGVVAMAFGGVLGAAIAGAFGGVLGAAWPRAFLTAVRTTHAISSSVAPLAAVLFLLNLAFSPTAAGTKVADGLGAAGTAVAANTARLMLQMPAPCLPPHARPDFCKMAHKCTPNGQASAGFGHSSVWKSGHMALPFFNVAVSTLPLSWSGIWGAGAASASCRACCAASTNCCGSLSLFFTSWKLCAEAHIGWRSCRSNLSASAKPWPGLHLALPAGSPPTAGC